MDMLAVFNRKSLEVLAVCTAVKRCHVPAFALVYQGQNMKKKMKKNVLNGDKLNQMDNSNHIFTALMLPH